MDLCSYGCGNTAIKTFKSGKHCCSNSVNSCPAKPNRKKDLAYKSYDWEAIQKFYDNGHTIRECVDHFAIEESSFGKAKSDLLFTPRSLSEARKLSNSPGKCLDPLREENRRAKLRHVAKHRGLGGYVKGSGRGKKGWYNGIFCDSSWELAYVVYCSDHNVEVIRNTEKFTYTFKDVEKNYIPDFIVNDKYVEIKGYKTDEWFAKLKAFPHDITVLYEKDMKPYLQYVTDKYGKDFTSLYR